MKQVLDHLSILEPTRADAPRPAAQALAQVRERIEDQQRNSLANRLVRYFTVPGRRTALAPVILVFLLALSFSFPAVRAAASDFLGLFRVQKFAAISVSPEQIAILERVAEEGLTPGEFEVVDEPGGLTAVDSLSEAGRMTGLTVRSLTTLGEPTEIYVTDGGSGRLTIDVDGARAILAATGVDPSLLPDSLDGRQVDVTVFTGVEQRWADNTWLMQAESPLVEYPEGLDPAVLGQGLLQVLGMNEGEALRLAGSIDWTSTLLLPVPQDFARFSEVTVDGISSLALSSLDGEHGLIMWQKQGIIYLLNGPGSTAELVSLANSLQ